MQALRMVRKNEQRALIVGLGLTGFSCARYLGERGYRVTVVDSRANPPMLTQLRTAAADVECHLGGFEPRLFDNPGLLVVSPGVPLREPVIADAIARGVTVVGDIELFAREAAAPVIAVTGANGKSTVTALTAAICREAGLDARLGGNIGIPALSLLAGPVPDVYVLEVSSFQLETTHSLNARAATVLNLTHDHMDRYVDLAEYGQAKARIFRGDGVMVLNADDPRVVAMALPARSVVRFSLTQVPGTHDFGLVAHAGEEWLGRSGEAWVAASSLRLQGRHNLANALAAMALADTVGASPAAMARAIRAFAGLPHRCQVVAERDGVLWINDSKATNIGATAAALSGQTRPVVLIAGGEGKGADFTGLREAVRAHVKALVLIGRDAPLIEVALGDTVETIRANDMVDAVARAGEHARAGDVVLLAPGCASFDMFRDYEHRGEAFTAAVHRLLAMEGGA